MLDFLMLVAGVLIFVIGIGITALVVHLFINFYPDNYS